MRTVFYLPFVVVGAIIFVAGCKKDCTEKTSSSKEKFVRIVYIIPADKSFNSTYYNGIKTASPNLQAWYKEQMNGKSYRLYPSLDTLKSSHNAEWFNAHNVNSGSNSDFYFYYNGWNETKSLLKDSWNSDLFVYSIFVDAYGKTGAGASGWCVLPENDLKGLSGQMPESINRWIGGWGHELGHAFGLPHPDGPDPNALMSTGMYNFPDCVLLPNDKITLSNSGFFTSEN